MDRDHPPHDPAVVSGLRAKVHLPSARKGGRPIGFAEKEPDDISGDAERHQADEAEADALYFEQKSCGGDTSSHAGQEDAARAGSDETRRSAGSQTSTRDGGAKAGRGTAATGSAGGTAEAPGATAAGKCKEPD